MKFDVGKFARLARVKLTPKESKKFNKDLGDVLSHFSELKELNTDKVVPMTGGTSLTNVFRDDQADSKDHRVSGGTEQFSESKDGYLKVPKVFE